MCFPFSFLFLTWITAQLSFVLDEISLLRAMYYYKGSIYEHTDTLARTEHDGRLRI